MYFYAVYGNFRSYKQFLLKCFFLSPLTLKNLEFISIEFFDASSSFHLPHTIKNLHILVNFHLWFLLWNERRKLAADPASPTIIISGGRKNQTEIITFYKFSQKAKQSFDQCSLCGWQFLRIVFSLYFIYVLNCFLLV